MCNGNCQLNIIQSVQCAQCTGYNKSKTWFLRIIGKSLRHKVISCVVLFDFKCKWNRWAKVTVHKTDVKCKTRLRSPNEKWSIRWQMEICENSVNGAKSS